MDHPLRSSAARAGNSRAIESGARLGYAASGVLHLLLGWLALQLALGHVATADQTGALASLATTSPGRVLLTLALLAAGALAVIAVPGLAAARAPARASLQE